MEYWNKLPEPLNFNPLKHHIGFIRSYTGACSSLAEEEIKKDIIPVLKHIGTSVADIYTGALSLDEIVSELNKLRQNEKLYDKKSFLKWLSQSKSGYRKFTLSDNSSWVIKYLHDKQRYFHVFPGRNMDLTVRSRGNSLKTAILYDILYDKGDILLGDLNPVRKMLSLSPLRNIESASGIISDIRMLQSV